MDDLLAEFLAETREMLTAIGGELVAWEADPTDRARLDAVFRFVHTVKGNCGFFDFPRLEALSHAAEDALAEVRAGRRAPSRRLVSAVLAVIDRIAVMVDAIEAGEELPARGDDILIAALAIDDDLSEGPTAHDLGDDGTATRSVTLSQRSIRLPVGLLDSVMSSVSDLVLARNDLARRLRLSDADPTVGGPFERLSTILDQVREAVTRMRMQRIEHLFGALPRLVRDLSAELGKQVMVDFEGGDVELDREMIEMVRDPLTHILRNAVDHGIEAPAERRARGKREIGTLLIAARQSGNRIVLAVTDDGRGIDGDRLVEKAVAAGAISASEAAELSHEARLNLIFEPGISTAAAVTAVSGRGVGMDVVRANIERVGGSLAVTSTPGEGTRIVLSLPLTLTIIPSLTIGAAGQMFALPRSYVEEIIHGRAAHIEFTRAGDAVLASVRGRRVACLSLSAELGLSGDFTPEACTLVLVRLAGGDLFALAVDRIHDHEELVIKPLAPALMATGIYAGSTLLDDGNPVLMLDVAGLARNARVVAETRQRADFADSGAEIDAQTTPVLVVVGLDGARKAIRLAAIQRIERIAASAIDWHGEQPRAVIGDALFPLAGAVAGAALHGHANVVRLTDGTSEIAYVFDSIVDTVELAGEITQARQYGPIEGTALVEGRPVEVIDTHWLFANHASPPRPLDAPLCRLADDDTWARTFLAPIVEAAGYRIADPGFQGQADVTILSESAPPQARSSGRVITLCADPDQTAGTADAVYRYDRVGLVTALAAIRRERAA